VGNIISEYDRAKNENFPSESKFRNRAEYWESYMTSEQIQQAKNKLHLFSLDGKPTQIKAFKNEGVFWCSDSDRVVEFLEVE
jgi:hypothetical protein